MLIGDYILADLIASANNEVSVGVSSELAIRRIKASCTAAQLPVVETEFPNTSVICPRRAGKSHSLVAKALIKTLEVPKSRVLIISPTMLHARQNFWTGAPGGITEQLADHKIGYQPNHTYMTWTFENGSKGRVTGVMDMDSIDKLRGAPAENDLIIIDECQNFKPEVLAALIERVITPGLMSRKGQLVLAGTPGLIPSGIFFDATCLRATDGFGEDRRFTCRNWDDTSPERAEALWQRHNWSIAANTAMPHQWEIALRTKRMRRWADDHPVWVREYLGEWVTDAGEMVFGYVAGRLKEASFVNWRGGELPQSSWVYVMGVDYGFEDATAFCVLAYSHERKEVWEVYSYKEPHLTADQVALKISVLAKTYGVSRIVVDTSHKNMSEELRQRYGLPIEYADKANKYSFIELCNSDFASGRIKVIDESPLHHELIKLVWDLSRGTKAELAARNALTVPSGSEDHIADAFLYAWRYCYHTFAYFTLEDQEVKEASMANVHAFFGRAIPKPSAEEYYDDLYENQAEFTASLRRYPTTGALASRLRPHRPEDEYS